MCKVSFEPIPGGGKCVKYHLNQYQEGVNEELMCKVSFEPIPGGGK